MIRYTLLLSLVVFAVITSALAAGFDGDYGVIEMRSPQKKTKLSGGGTNWNFLPGGKWEMTHSNGTVQAGKYTLRGNIINFKLDDGEDFGTYAMTISGRLINLEGAGNEKGYGYTLERIR